MIRSVILAISLALSLPACAHPPVSKTQVRIVCTVATPWDAEQCWVEFGRVNTGAKVEAASRAEAEELVAILLSNPGAAYVFDDGLTPAKGGPATRKARERVDMVGSRTAP
jgi:hypothetical protein